MVSSYQLRLQEALSALQRNAGIFAQNASELRAIATRLSGTAQNLVSGADGWQGDAAKAFQAAWERHLSDSQHITSDLEAITPILQTLASLIEAELTVANELERLDPVSALRRLGLPVPHSVESVEQFVIEEATQSILEKETLSADAVTAGELEAIGIIGVPLILSQTPAPLENLAGAVQNFLDEGTFILEQLAKITPALKGAGSALDELAPYLQAIDVILQFAAGSQHDLRTFSIDAGGGVIQFLIGATPQGKIIEGVAAAIQISSAGLAEIQDLYASMFPGELGNELKDPADNLRITSDNANFTKVCDDAAKLIIDTHGTILLASSNPGIFIMSVGAGYLNSAFGWHIPGATSPTTLLSDSGELLGDSGKLVLSPVQLVVNSQAMQYDDRLAAFDKVVQNTPLPGSIKNTWNKDTITVIHGINDVSDFVSKPDDIEHLGTTAWDWLTH